MLQKVVLFAAVLSLVLIAVSSENAGAQVSVSKAGRPWEIDGCAIPLDNNNESHDQQSVALRGDTESYISIAPGTATGSSVYEYTRRSGSNCSPLVHKNSLFREIFSMLYYLTF